MRTAHSFNIECATKWGVSEAVMLHHLTFWVAKNSANNRHIHDGYAWTYNTYRAFTTLHPYWSKSQVASLRTKLEDIGCIQSSQLLKNEWKRVKWYTILKPVRDCYGIPEYDCTVTESTNARNRDIEDDKPVPSLIQLKEPQIEVERRLVYPFEDDAFFQLWEEWKIDRKERGIKTYTLRGEQAALTKLNNDADGDVRVAIQMIQNSIANGWQGIFKINNQKTKQRGGVATTGVDVDKLKYWANQGG